MIIPSKLKSGDEVRIIAPSDSFLPNITADMRTNAVKMLNSLGLDVSFGKYIDDRDMFSSAIIEKRLKDLHNAFADPNVKAIIPVSGGTTANELLKHIDYELIKANPTIFCGLSDHTNVQLALYTKADMVTYYGPHFADFGLCAKDDYTLRKFKKCLFEEEAFEVNASDHYYTSAWQMDKYPNDGLWNIMSGKAEGKLIGGNLLTMNFLKGSPYFPDLSGAMLFIENNDKVSKEGFFNQLQALRNLSSFDHVKGLDISLQNGPPVSLQSDPVVAE